MKGILYLSLSFLLTLNAFAKENRLAISDLKIQLTERSYSPAAQPLVKTSELLYDSKYLNERGKTFTDLDGYVYNVPVEINRGTKLFYEGRFLNDLDDKDIIGGTGAWLLNIPITNRSQCVEILAFGEDLEVQTYDLCLYVTEGGMESFQATIGPFFYRKKMGAWAELSMGAVVQDLSQPGVSSSTNPKELSIRAGAGLWWNHINADISYRQKITAIGEAADISPRWVDFFASYKFEIAKMKNLTITLSPVLGFEYYKNQVSSPLYLSRYIDSYSAPTIGFRSRFIYKSRIELGGEFIYAILEDSSKFFIQGDLEYWLFNDLAIGGGYWIDRARVNAGTITYSETSFALELKAKYIF